MSSTGVKCLLLLALPRKPNETSLQECSRADMSFTGMNFFLECLQVVRLEAGHPSSLLRPGASRSSGRSKLVRAWSYAAYIRRHDAELLTSLVDQSCSCLLEQE